MNFSLKAFLTSGLIIMLNSIPFCGNAQQTDDAKLWFNTPASASAKDTSAGWINDAEWLKALPVGNGFLGAMVFGDVNIERIQLNEKSLWSGGTDDSDNPEAAKYLQEIRNLLFAGKYKEATALTNKTQVCKGVGSAREMVLKFLLAVFKHSGIYGLILKGMLRIQTTIVNLT